MRLAIFLTGPIGVGKSTLGAALAAKIGGRHVDGDVYQIPDRPWYAATRRVAHALLEEASKPPHPVVLGYPLRCTDHLFLRRHLDRRGVRSVFVCLSMAPERIFDPRRGRGFSNWERERTAEMIALGYDRQPWADLLFEPVDGLVAVNRDRLAAAIQALTR